MSTRSQKRKIVEELISGEFESSVRNTDNTEVEQVPGPSKQKSPKIRPENLDERKSSLKNLAKILIENQKDNEDDSSGYKKENCDGSRLWY